MDPVLILTVILATLCLVAGVMATLYLIRKQEKQRRSLTLPSNNNSSSIISRACSTGLRGVGQPSAQTKQQYGRLLTVGVTSDPIYKPTGIKGDKVQPLLFETV